MSSNLATPTNSKKGLAVCRPFLRMWCMGKFCQIVFIVLFVLASSALSSAGDRRQLVVAERVKQAVEWCGYEPTPAADEMLRVAQGTDARHQDRALVAKLWRETFACNEAYAGDNCFAARWQLCQRAYGEYGPDGILIRGLIKPVIKK